MKVSLNWLKDYITTGVSAEALAHKLTMAGLEVETVETVGGDRVFEIEVTPNRADCLNMIGISRELSAILNKPRKVPHIYKPKATSHKCDIKIEDKKGCSRYIGTLIEGVEIGKTPERIFKHLNSLGMRTVNNVVDITNFVLMEFGQPLHGFDYDKLAGGKIIVRRAKKGEKIVTIDGDEVSLDPSILIISDAKKPVAIAGVMGGKDTEITDKTVNVLLESAYFDPVLVRQASRKVGIVTDSSYRFERDVNFQNVETGSRRATDLIKEIAGGTVIAYSDLGAKKRSAKKEKISVSVSKANHFLGANIPQSQYTNILKKLDFQVKVKKGTLSVVAPDFRRDIHQGVDVIEEVSRVIGYDNLPMTLPQIKASGREESLPRAKRQILRDRLIAQGLNEIITFSMVNEEALKKSKQGDLKGVNIMNPLSADQEMMRPSMLPNMLSVARNNMNHNQVNLKLFEIGKVYTAKSERESLSIIMTGVLYKDWRRNSPGKVELFDLSGAIGQGLSAIGGLGMALEQAPLSIYEPGTGAVINVGGKELGSLGKLNEEILNNWDIKEHDVYYACVDLDPIFHLPQHLKKFDALDEYPSMTRDVSVALGKSVSFAQVQNVISEHRTELLRDVQLQEEYLGEKIAKDQRGLVFSCIYQSKNKTLREEEVNQSHQLILSALVEKLDATIR